MSRIATGMTLGLGLLLGACQQPDPIGSPDNDPKDSLPTSKSPDSSCTGLMAYKDIQWENGEWHDSATTWAGDSLVVDYRFGGGCRTHDFTPLCADYDKSGSPGKAILWVRHTGSEDPCKALLYRRLSFDAAAVKAQAGAGASVQVRFVDDGQAKPQPGSLPRISRATADSMARHSAPFKIESWEETGDSLIVNVAYSGGCRQHLFQVYASDYVYLSLPGQVDIWIYHLDNGDSCEALLRKRLAFDISDLKSTNPLYVYRVIPLVP